MHILVVGTGYVGLVTGAALAEVGHTVLCLDIDQAKITQLRRGVLPIYEPGLEAVVQRNYAAGRLRFTTDYKEGVREALVCMIAVSTPSEEDGSADLSYVTSAAQRIAEEMEGYKLIVNKSTVPVGSAARVRHLIEQTLSRRGRTLPFDVVSNPEFLKEGEALHDVMHPDRIIIGSDRKEAAALMEALYAPFGLPPSTLIHMDPPSAEMTKYAANALLASRISFMNEIAALCARTGADITKVREGVGSDPRIGPSFLHAGMGYGGSCFPKDIKALYKRGEEEGVAMPLLEAIERVNYRQKRVLGEMIVAHFEGNLTSKVIAIWGLAFKPGTDDMREAPSLVLIHQLVEAGALLRLYDPVAMPRARALLPVTPQLTWCRDPYDAADGADALALVTEWESFRTLDFSRLTPRTRLLFDGRNQYTQEALATHGYTYYSIGRAAAPLSSPV